MRKKTLTGQTHFCSGKQKKSLTKIDEKELLQQLAEGDINAFWPLWQQHQDYLHSRCIGWMGGDRFEGEEALSLAMLKARDKLPKNATKIINIRPWLIRFTYNFCMDLHRKNHRKTVSLEYIEEIAIQPDRSLNFSFDSPESRILNNELELFIRQAINALPDRLRIPFVLLYYEQVPYSEIAQKLAISEQNAYKRNQQARDILKQRLKKYLSGFDNSFLNSSETLDMESDCPVESLQHDCSVLKNTSFKSTVIDYNLTATCLEQRSHRWDEFYSLVVY